MKKSEALNILGLSDGASDDDIKQAHRKLIRQNHPDRFIDPQKKSTAEEKTKLINEARDVLISRKWEPEFGPRAGAAGTYSNPYTANPFGGAWPGSVGYTYTTQGRPANGQTEGDPFYGMPFTYVWTSWDNVGTNSSGGSGSSSAGSNPYTNPFDAFSTIFTQTPRKSAKQLYDEARADLKTFLSVVGVKAVILALCAIFGGLSTGMFAYMVTTVLFAISREVKGCSSFLVIPFIIVFGPLIMLLMPSFGAGIGLGLALFFGVAVMYDITALRRIIERMRTYKEKAKMEQQS